MILKGMEKIVNVWHKASESFEKHSGSHTYYDGKLTIVS